MNLARHVSDDDLRVLWQAHDLGPFWQAVAASGGVRNECYIVNNEMVARFNTHDPQFAKFKNEQVAYGLLAESGLPVPEVVLLDDSRQVVPYDVIVVTKLPGLNVAESWRAFLPRQVEELAVEAGRCLAQLHGFVFAGFGNLSRLHDQPFPSWLDYFGDYARRYIVQAERARLVDAALMSRLVAIVEGASDLLSRVTQGVLVHSDFHYENILHVDGKLSGIIDFEWALSGDPTYDFMAADARNDMLPGVEDAFLAGYVSVRPLDVFHDRRLAVYRLFLGLETAVGAAGQDDRGGVRAALDGMRRLLMQLEAGEV